MYQNIKRMRENRELKQKDVARYLHVAQNTYSQYETGTIMLTIETLEKLAKFYNTSTDYLMGLTDNPKPYPKTLPNR
ncbi:MAG: helix-turn-helix transcriptional regulator [Oscillospiraceae bacterium]